MKKTKFIIPVIILTLFVIKCSDKNPNMIKSQGVVDGDVVTVRAKTQGSISRLDFKEGQVVKKNHLMAKIDDQKTKNKIKELEITARQLQISKLKLHSRKELVYKNLIYFKDQVTRFKRLLEKNAVAGEKLEQWELKLKETKTRLAEINQEESNLKLSMEKIENQKEYLHLLLEDHQVLAPFEGLIIDRFISSGETVFGGSAVADILNLSSLYIETFLEEGEINTLKIGGMVRIIIDGFKKELTGRIVQFGRKAEFSPKYIISEEERKALLYKVKIKLNPGDQDNLRLGMVLTVVTKIND